ncbi:MAG: hypothetical protein ACR2G7_08885 [Acidimicrobiales bacterium]
MILVDDHYVLDQLTTAPGPTQQAVATTCSWWWRLSSALTGGRGGALSRYLSLSPIQQEGLRRTVEQLPHHLVILDFRDLVPAMALASAAHGLNQVGAEALVVAETLSASIVVGRDTPNLRRAAQARSISYEISPPPP